MIDIHTHILYGLDDGAADMAESVAMARAAACDGVADLVATPHGAAGGSDEPLTEAMVFARVRVLQEALDAASIPIRLHAGVEVWLSPHVLAQRHAGKAFGIDSGPYMLVELPFYQIPTYTDQVVFDLEVAGVKPLLAHPERYGGLLRTLDPLYKLVRRGVLTQINAGSLLGQFGPTVKELVEILLTHNLAHVIASDAHSAERRPPVLSAAVERAASLIGSERAQAMVTTVPAAILAGESMEMPEPEPYRPKRRWFPWGGLT